MIFSHGRRASWYLAAGLALALGCGGGDESTPGSDGDARSPKPPADMGGGPEAGVPNRTLNANDPHPRVEFETTAGRFVVRLDRDKTPITVENFLRYVNGEFYDDTIFHQVTAGYAIVGGSHEKDLIEKAAREDAAIPNEAATGLSNLRGTIGMAREPKVVDSARCQFYINLADNTGLDYREGDAGQPAWETAGYCAFGSVVEGMDVVDAIAQAPVENRGDMNDVPIDPIVIQSVHQLPPEDADTASPPAAQ